MVFLNKLIKTRAAKEHINKMILIAAHEELLSPTEITFLKKEVNFITSMEVPEREKIMYLKKQLPRSQRARFNVIYFLANSLMQNGSMEEHKEQVLASLAEMISPRKERAKELVAYLKNYIQKGLNLEDSYRRFGYLLENPKFN